VHDLALVLLEALTQQKTLEDASRNLPLPAPFDEIVGKGVSGAWGLPQIKEALKSAGTPRGAVRETVAPVAEAIVHEAPVATVETKPVEAAPRVDRIHVPVATQRTRFRLGSGAWTALGVVGVLVVLLAWLFLRKDGVTEGSVPQSSSVAAPAVAGSAPEVPVAAPAAPEVKAPAAASGSAAPVGERWRVVAFTYNHEEQAKEKAQTVARRYPNLHPEVFSPSGHAPYLVTVGGAMSRDEAFALVRTARSEGLPRDIYAQNYKGQGR
jgi:hypothetical protein